MGKNTKALKTKKVIQKSLMSIYTEKPYFNITVKEVCEKANIHRTTFYLHYQNLNEVFREVEDSILKEIESQSKHLNYIVPVFQDKDSHLLKETNWGILEFFKENKNYLLPLLNPYGDLHFINKYKKVIYKQTISALKKTNTSYGEYEEYVIRYVASGIVETLYHWLKKDDLSVVELTTFFLKFNSENPFLERN